MRWKGMWNSHIVCFVLCSISQANLDESQMSSSPFLRALMTAVCKAAVKGKHSTTWRRNMSILLKMHHWLQYLLCGVEQLSMHSLCLLLYWTDDNTNCRVDTAIIQRRLPVLLKYLNSDTERQLQALYALQALIVALDQPPSKCWVSFNYDIYFSLSLFFSYIFYQRILKCHYKQFLNCENTWKHQCCKQYYFRQSLHRFSSWSEASSVQLYIWALLILFWGLLILVGLKVQIQLILYIETVVYCSKSQQWTMNIN